ncbi:uncharacterized protein BP5553_10320 [Venustampulla echinocandica]|uniref:Uncharacterized protein n=1 Tax=Venustampulla echinocandica TaxID=2656787 RepID=A0A370T9X8_9HELO|nr:uncharacterized protein BP5553_10320 [Venustampulla echinocandica]RDL30442.1 hypothetical protein BP5553_10320 [Venustampulla echinocandica]
MEMRAIHHGFDEPQRIEPIEDPEDWLHMTPEEIAQEEAEQRFRERQAEIQEKRRLEELRVQEEQRAKLQPSPDTWSLEQLRTETTRLANILEAMSSSGVQEVKTNAQSSLLSLGVSFVSLNSVAQLIRGEYDDRVIAEEDATSLDVVFQGILGEFEKTKELAGNSLLLAMTFSQQAVQFHDGELIPLQVQAERSVAQLDVNIKQNEVTIGVLEVQATQQLADVQASEAAAASARAKLRKAKRLGHFISSLPGLRDAVNHAQDLVNNTRNTLTQSTEALNKTRDSLLISTRCREESIAIETQVKALDGPMQQQLSRATLLEQTLVTIKGQSIKCYVQVQSCLTELKGASFSLSKTQIAGNILATLLEGTFDAVVGEQAKLIFEDLKTNDDAKGSVRLLQADRVLLLEDAFRTIMSL